MKVALKKLGNTPQHSPGKNGENTYREDFLQTVQIS